MNRAGHNFNKLILSNGLTVLLYKMSSVKSVYAELIVKVGCINEKLKERGISHFVEHVGTLGTEKLKTKLEIARYAQNIGASYNAHTSRFATGYWVKLPSQNIGKGLELIKEFVFAPNLEADIINEKAVVLSEINDHYGNPETKFWHEFWEKRFKTRQHPYSCYAIGLPETVRTFDLKKILAWRRIYYHPNNMILCIAGNFETQAVIHQIEKLFGNTKSGDPIKNPVFSSNDYSPSFVDSFPNDRSQISTDVSFPAFGAKEGGRLMIMLLGIVNSVTSNGVSSRLFQRLREKDGLVYDVWGSLTVYDYLGALEIGSSTSPNNLINVMKGIKEETDKIVLNGITQKEIDLAVKSANYSILLKFDSPYGAAEYISNEEFNNEEIWFPERYIEESKKITKRKVDGMARKVLDFSRVNIGVFGNIPDKYIEEIKDIFTLH